MKCFSIILLTFLVGSSIVRAQDKQLAVNVYKPDPEHEMAGPVKLFLNRQELPVLNVQSPPDVALHVVFVLDNSDHQQGMMKLAKDYVVALASKFRVPHAMFTLLVAAKEPRVLKETSDASELISGVVQSKIAEAPTREESADLSGGLANAIHLLKAVAGVRVVVIISDDDDDITGPKLTALKGQLATSHVLCYSILLAQHDFFGSKAHVRRGSRLNQLSSFSGGAQYQTDWQQRNGDPKILSAVAERISGQSLISFTLPSDVSIKPGVSTLRAEFTGNSHKITTSPAVITH